MKWINNSNGTADPMLTLGVVSLGVILFKFLFSEITIGTITFGNLDALVIAAILTPTLGASVANRHSDNLLAAKGKTNDQN